MKPIWRRITALLSLTVALTANASPTSQFRRLWTSTPKHPALEQDWNWQKLVLPASARVKEVRGAAEYFAGRNTWKPLNLGSIVKPGMTIRTRSLSELLLYVEELETLVRVTPQSIIQVERTFEAEPPVAKKPVEDLRGSARVRAVRGQAEILAGKDVWLPVKVNQKIKRGSIIRTVSNTSMDLFFPDQKLVVRMSPETVLRIDQLEVDAASAGVIETVLVVPQGQIQTNLPTQEKYQLRSAQVLYRLRD